MVTNTVPEVSDREGVLVLLEDKEIPTHQIKFVKPRRTKKKRYNFSSP